VDDADQGSGAARGVKAQAYTTRATARVARAGEKLLDMDYCHPFRNALKPARLAPTSWQLGCLADEFRRASASPLPTGIAHLPCAFIRRPTLVSRS
jgi:hypothetical protein